jgi:hypothetical protein
METKILVIVGLSLNTIGSLILLLPNFNPWKHISNDEIVGENLNDEKFIQKKDLISSLYSIAGFIFLLIGFVLQLIAAAITK